MKNKNLGVLGCFLTILFFPILVIMELSKKYK